MQFPQIKTDPNRPYHYIIGVRIKDSIKSKNSGKMYLSYGPVTFTNEDVENFKQALILTQDPLLKTNMQDALEIYNCAEISHIIYAMKLSARTNNATLHHFSFEEEITDEDADSWFGMFIETANNLPEQKQKLLESII